MSTADVAVSFPAAAAKRPVDSGAFRQFMEKYSPKQGWDAFLLLLAAGGVAGFTVVEAAWVETPGLLAIILWSSLTGLVLAKVRLPWPVLHPIGLWLGFVTVVWQASSIVAGETLTDRLQEGLNRLDLWYAAATTGGISTDLLPFTIALLTLAWLLGYLSAWFLFRNTNPWIGLVLGGIALLTNLSYLPEGYESRFFLFIFPAMLLVARIGLVQRQDRWRRSNFRFLSGGRWLSIQTTSAISVVVLVSASFLPIRVYVWQSAVDTWNIGRTPVEHLENEFARLFSGITARKDVAGRFFGDTLPFQGKVSLGGDIVLQARSKYPAYWLNRTYSTYTSQGWIAGQLREVRVGPESLPPPPHESFKRVPVTQDVLVSFDTNTLWAGGNVDWISREAVALTLAPPEYRIDIHDPAGDRELPDDVRAVAAELRTMLNPLTAVFVEAEIAKMLSLDMTLIGVSPGIEDTKRSSIDTVTVARKEPTIPDVVGWRFVKRLRAKESYTTRSYISMASVEELRKAPTDYSGFIKGHYLQLPASLPQRVRDLAAEITADVETPMDKALALQDYLRGDALEYSQNIDKPLRGADGVDYFLFETTKGYSDYFASAMAVLLRAVGVPARMAVGYAPGQEQEGSDYRAIRDSDSHGWTQAYFPGHGWIDFEPTSIWPLQPRGETEETEAGSAAEAPEPGGQSSTEEDPCFTGGIDPAELLAIDDEDCLGPETQVPDIGETAAQDMLLDLAIGAATLAIAAAVLALLTRLIWAHGFASSTSPDNLYTKMGRLGTLAGIKRRSHQTPIEYARFLGGPIPGIAAGAHSVASTFAAGRYGRKALSDEDVGELNESWKGVRGGLVAQAFRRLFTRGGSSQA